MFYSGCVLSVDGFINQKPNSTALGSIMSVYGLISGGVFKSTDLKKPKKPSIKEPLIRQQLNINQTTAMVEAFNRKLYSNILRK